MSNIFKWVKLILVMWIVLTLLSRVHLRWRTLRPMLYNTLQCLKNVIKPLQPSFAYLHLQKTSVNLLSFCFQGVYISNAGLQWVNAFHPTGPFLHTMKTLENFRFSRKPTGAWNRLRYQSAKYMLEISKLNRKHSI